MNKEASLSSLDFDGKYGLNYQSSIRESIPGYETFLEIAASTLKFKSKEARRCLVIGPGAGQELSMFLNALPEAHFSLIEPSAQMRSFCTAELKRIHATQRCLWIPSTLAKAEGLMPASFDAVIALNLMHLFPPKEQARVFDQISSLLAPKGSMLLSSYSENQGSMDNELIISIARERLRIRGVGEEQINAIFSARNKSVFSFNPINMPNYEPRKNLSAPIQLMQVGLIRMWLWTHN